MEKGNPVLLSFDLEEFDMPLEYGHQISFAQQMKASDEGMEALMPVLEQQGVTATFFTTANYALHRPALVRELARNHEIASHTFYHSRFEEAHLATSRKVLEEISGQTVCGLRMPRMRRVRMEAVSAAGYRYDSSINPTWLPGRYNNLKLPRTVYSESGMLRLPASVTPNLRIPLFWLLFKNIPISLYTRLAVQTLKNDGYLNLYFHPWEFTGLAGYGLPRYTRATDGQALTDRLNSLITVLKKEGVFTQTRTFMHPFGTDGGKEKIRVANAVST